MAAANPVVPTQTAPVTIVGQVVMLTQWGNSLYMQLDLNVDGVGDIWVKVMHKVFISDSEGNALDIAAIELGDYVQITKYYWDEKLQLCQVQEMKLCEGNCEQLKEMCQNVGDIKQLKEHIKNAAQFCQQSEGEKSPGEICSGIKSPLEDEKQSGGSQDDNKGKSNGNEGSQGQGGGKEKGDEKGGK